VLKKWILAIVVLSLLVSCASPLNHADFRYLGEGDGTEEAFLADRERCKWKSPPIPIVHLWVYRSCMANRDWVVE
jgi:hypothetical protein